MTTTTNDISTTADTFHQYASHTLTSAPGYEVFLDEHRRGPDTALLIRANITPEASAPLARLEADWAALRKCVFAPIFAISSEDDDDRYSSLMRVMGFTYLGPLLCSDGVTRGLFVHNVPQPSELQS